MTGFLITFIVPKITSIFQDTGQELPKITQVVLGMSDFLSNHYVFLFVSIISILVSFKLFYARMEAFRKVVDRLILKIPIIGVLIQNHELSRFSYILALMLNSGVSYAQAVQLANTTMVEIEL